MKRSVVILLATLLLAATGAVTHGSEANRNAVARQFSSDQGSRGSGTGGQAVGSDPAAIAKLIENINAAVRTNKQRMLSIIVINTDIASSQLEREKAETGMTFGDVYVAHSLALATKKKFSAMVAMHKSGKTWAQIAKTHGVSLKGSSELIKEMQKQ